MIIILLLAAAFIHSIVGNYVCPPAPHYDPSCMWIRIRPGCSSDQDCTKPGTKCCKSRCNVLQCVDSVQGVVKDGICPPVPNVVLDFCLSAKISSNCGGNDANCPGQKKCCPTPCGSQNCRDPINNSVCPPYRKDIVCIDFDQQCTTNYDCKDGNICCSVECGTACKPPYRPPYVDNPCPPDPPCPIPPLVPPGECPRRCRFIYEDIGGVSCKVRCEFGPAGPTGPPCLPNNCIQGHIEPPVVGNCPNGNPLPNIFCGRERQDCPPGYSCNIDPLDRFAVCCSDRIKYGSCPAVKPDDVVICAVLCSGDDSCPGNKKCCPSGCGLLCMNPIGEHICPIIDCSVPCKHGYELDNYGCQTCICKPYRCLPPPCPPPPKDACIEAQYTIIEGVKCPACYKIVPCKGNCAQINCPNQCEFGFVVDSDGCQTCDCKPSPCIRPPCLPPPEDACTEDEYRIIDGVKCPWCYKIVPCKDKVCPLVPPNSVCYGYTRVCKDDSSCSAGQKCCRQGCSFVCVNPV